MESKNSTILVTGASGNLGLRLINYLSDLGYTNVTATCRKVHESLPNLNGIKWESLDILDTFHLEEIMHRHDIVIHAAAKVCYQASEKAEIFKVNIEGTANVVNTATAAGIKKFIHISSTAALGLATDLRILDEKYTPDPSQFITDYALSKWFAELEVWRGISEGLQANIISPSVILIPKGEHNNTGVYVRKIKEGLNYYPSGSTGFVHVDDVVKAIEILIQSDLNEEKFIISNDNLSWKVFFENIANHLGKTTKFKPVPSQYLWMLKLTNNVRRLFGKCTPLPTALTNQMMKKLKYDGSKALTLPGFSYTDLQDTIKVYAASSS